MKHAISPKKTILFLLLLCIILCIFLLPSAGPSAPQEAYDIASLPDNQPLTEEEKQEKYQDYLKARLAEDIQAFCGNSVDIEPVFNDKKEVTEIILVLDSADRLEEDTKLQIIKAVSTAYGLQPDSVSFSCH